MAVGEPPGCLSPRGERGRGFRGRSGAGGPLRCHPGSPCLRAAQLSHCHHRAAPPRAAGPAPSRGGLPLPFARAVPRGARQSRPGGRPGAAWPGRRRAAVLPRRVGAPGRSAPVPPRRAPLRPSAARPARLGPGSSPGPASRQASGRRASTRAGGVSAASTAGLQLLLRHVPARRATVTPRRRRRAERGWPCSECGLQRRFCCPFSFYIVLRRRQIRRAPKWGLEIVGACTEIILK